MFKYVEFQYPVEFVVNGSSIWANTSINCYISYSQDGVNFNYLCGEADHSLDSNGKLIETSDQGTAEADYWTTGIVADGLLAFAKWPYMRQCRWIRVYFSTSCTLYEIKHNVFVLADEIVAGTIHCANGITIASAEDNDNAIKLDLNGLRGWGGGVQSFSLKNDKTFWVGEDPASGTKYLQFDGTDVSVGRDTQLLGADAYNNTNIYIRTFFQSIDMYETITSGSPTSELISGSVRLECTSLNDEIMMRIYLGFPLGTHSWSKNRRFKTKVVWSAASMTDIKSYVTCGYVPNVASPTQRHFGFYLNGSTLYGTCANGTTQSTIDLSVAISSGTTYLLEAILTAGSKVQFYVNGVYKNELTTNLPSGTDWSWDIGAFHLKAEEAATKRLYFSEFAFLQD